MSKQSEAKERQGYNPEASQRVCGQCIYFKSDKVEQCGYDGKPNGYMLEKNLRCGLGGFTVKKLALCNDWAFNPF